MREVRVTRIKQNGALEIGFRFKSMDQLLDPDDPSPLPAREVTEFAEEYIASYLDGCNLKKIASIVVSLPRESLTPEEVALLPETIRRHFSFRIADLDDDRRVSRREGRISLALAIFNATIAILFVVVFAGYLEGPIVALLAGFVTILNWVTVWDTYEYFVYDYRRELRKRQVYRKLAGIEILVEGW
ncbi:MAG: hypothetical protein CVV31_02740 [Methanomicrobiales archaeon HGW-Methanomicrobiales-2]|jgi:hypothetical protein|nr:MAG: hypothetical protein CVV31_02740 [Methanomicrobiales archaeon HGW-Methanomicrobiales-2]